MQGIILPVECASPRSPIIANEMVQKAIYLFMYIVDSRFSSVLITQANPSDFFHGRLTPHIRFASFSPGSFGASSLSSIRAVIPLGRRSIIGHRAVDSALHRHKMQHSGLAAILLACFTIFSEFANAFWRLPCRGRTGVARLDPLVEPGKISSHAHTIHGAGSKRSATDFQSLIC